jgi:pimeloyl-ACP methyl ester carboxylesterase
MTEEPQPGALDWYDCGELSCATLTVPLDYDDLGAGTIDLAVVRRSSSGDEPIGSLILNPGGPGGSGVGFVRTGGARGLLPWFDIVSWDPRGVGASSGLPCGDVESFIKLDPEPDDDAERTELETAARSIAERCGAADPALLRTMTTETSARDLEQLRRALDEPLNYLGFSYGTHIGLQYAAMYPDQIRAMALDGVVDPRETLTELLIGQAQAIEDVLADAMPRYREVAAMVEAEPLPARGGEKVGPGLLGIAAFAAVYEPRGADRLDRALGRALEGDGSALAELAEDYYAGSSSYAGYFGVLCVDSPRPEGVDAWQRFSDEIHDAAPDLGASIGNELLPCAFWPATPPTTDTAPSGWDPSVPPILLVASTRDAATPLDDAERVHRALPNAALVVREGAGHTSFGTSECVSDAVTSYLVELQRPDEGTICPS